MGVTFEAYSGGVCCLCGAAGGFTGEHKIKASALRAEFGGGPMYVGRFGEQEAPLKLARGVKSKVLHFSAPVCGDCNHARTQAADLEFDRFHRKAQALHAAGGNPMSVFEDERYAAGSPGYLDVFRYFAKLMCCHLAEVGAPRPIHMSRFAIGRADENCVWLEIDEDWTFKSLATQGETHSYAAHGGLVVYGDRKTHGPNAFHSTLTVGGLRYIYFTRLNLFERVDLRINHRPFDAWCRARVLEALHQPLGDTELLQLGLAKDPAARAPGSDR